MANKFKCKYCDKTFKRKTNRDKHQETFCNSNPKKIKEKEEIENKINNILEQEELNNKQETISNTSNDILEWLDTKPYKNKESSLEATEIDNSDNLDINKEEETIEIFTLIEEPDKNDIPEEINIDDIRIDIKKYEIPEKTEENKEEPKYTMNELFLIQFFRNFNPNRVYINKVQASLLDPIYKEYGKKRLCDCSGEYTRMYIYLYNRMLEVLSK